MDLEAEQTGTSALKGGLGDALCSIWRLQKTTEDGTIQSLSTSQVLPHNLSPAHETARVNPLSSAARGRTAALEATWALLADS